MLPSGLASKATVLSFLFAIACTWASTPLVVQKGTTRLVSAQGPYVVDRSLVFGVRDTLVIEEGVEVQMTEYAKIMVRGPVEVRGTLQNPVRFRASDSTQGWVGLHFATGERTLLVQHLIIEHAFRNAITSAAGVMEGLILRGNYYGLWVERSPNLLLRSCHLTGNRYALAIGSASVQAEDCRITGNTYGVILEPGAAFLGVQAQATGNLEQDIQSPELTEGKSRIPSKVWRAIEARY